MSGRVTLIGAGPGDPGLLTIRGREALLDAQVVLFDRLVGDGVLAMMPESAEKIDVGKSSGRHLVPQDEINDLILRHARAGKRVVRLKGGDPYLFGRGAEELEAVVAENIPFEVVPGITSAIAAPAYAGIPVSHRDMASSVHIITGHARQGAAPSIAYDSLVELGGTLIFLMGVGSMPELTEGLMKAGMAPDTPAALVENGTRPGQRRLVATVKTIVERAEAEGFHPPSVFLVGGVCALAEKLDWFAARPLAGTRVVVTRPRSAMGTLAAKLRGLGCDVVEYPCIRTQPLPVDPALWSGLGGYDWLVFTSPAGVEYFFRGLGERGLDARALAGLRVAAVGDKTAAAAERCGVRPDLTPDTFDGKALAQALLQAARPGERALLFRAKAGAPELPAALLEGGLAVDDVAAYDTLYETPEAEGVRALLAADGVDCVTFTSASTVRGFVRSLPGLDLSAVTGVCIGEQTAAAAREAGLRVAVSRRADLDSLVDCIVALTGKAGEDR